jgi:hypothetical protein
MTLKKATRGERRDPGPAFLRGLTARCWCGCFLKFNDVQRPALHNNSPKKGTWVPELALRCFDWRGAEASVPSR